MTSTDKGSSSKILTLYYDIERQYIDLKSIILNKLDLSDIENNVVNELYKKIEDKYFIILKSIEIIHKGKDLYNYDHLIVVTYFKKIDLKIDMFKEVKGYLNLLESLRGIFTDLENFEAYLKSVLDHETIEDQIVKSKEKLEQIDKYSLSVQEKLKQASLISEKIQNKSVQDIYIEDSKKFKVAARIYEGAFYTLILFLILYFFGFYIHINNSWMSFSFAHYVNYELKPAFYIQKISVLILSATLAAFLLKRSLMNRKLADETYRISKEFDGLPLYMESLPDDIKQQIRTDLAYKYFGNILDKNGYGANDHLVMDQMKATTELTKTVADLAKIVGKETGK